MCVCVPGIFVCRHVGEDSYLEADYRLRCDDGAYGAHFAWAVFLTIFFVGGFPLGMFFLLFRNRHHLGKDEKTEDGDGDGARDRYKVLIEDFKPELWFWGPIDLVRKLLLSGLIVFFRRQTSVQLVLGILIASLFHILHSRFHPYKVRTASFCASCPSIIFSILRVICCFRKS